MGGLHTNLSFLQRMVAHPSFAAADLDTTFIKKHEEQLLGIQALAPETCALAAALMYQSLVAQVRHSPMPWGRPLISHRGRGSQSLGRCSAETCPKTSFTLFKECAGLRLARPRLGLADSGFIRRLRTHTFRASAA